MERENKKVDGDPREREINPAMAWCEGKGGQKKVRLWGLPLARSGHREEKAAKEEDRKELKNGEKLSLNMRRTIRRKKNIWGESERYLPGALDRKR